MKAALVRFVDSRERNDSSGALYTVFLWFSTLLWFLSRVVKRLEQDFLRNMACDISALFIRSARQAMAFHIIQMNKLSI